MIEAIKEIGRYVLDKKNTIESNVNEGFIQAICENLEYKKRIKDKDYIQRIIIINFNLEQVAYIIKKMNLFIANDSSLMHLASLFAGLLT